MGVVFMKTLLIADYCLLLLIFLTMTRMCIMFGELV